MGRILRVDVGNEYYHILNRANARLPIFKKEQDFYAFETILEEALEKYSMRLLAYCLMPNHWHFILHPRNDGDLNLFMQWITLTHTQRWHAHYKSIGHGHLYQGRYKSFLIQNERYLFNAIQYVESNALRAKLTKRAEHWKWSSLWRRQCGNVRQKAMLVQLPMEIPNNYLEMVNRLQSDKELECIRESVNKNKPFGGQFWLEKVIAKFDLGMTIRKPGRPKNGT